MIICQRKRRARKKIIEILDAQQNIDTSRSIEQRVCQVHTCWEPLGVDIKGFDRDVCCDLLHHEKLQLVQTIGVRGRANPCCYLALDQLLCSRHTSYTNVGLDLGDSYTNVGLDLGEFQHVDNSGRDDIVHRATIEQNTALDRISIGVLNNSHRSVQHKLLR
uniref:(northern house mosquito) hypothetical protein n=1 Tax=Culex pipiens TaxID=7175 RepID=A0A8D8FAA7_CULPI